MQPNKVVHQLLGCLDRDLLKLKYRENNQPHELTEENLLKVIKCTAVKKKNAWCIRENLHQMTQDMGKPVSSPMARLHGQARICKHTRTSEADRYTQPNDFRDIAIGEWVNSLVDHEIKEQQPWEVTQAKDLAVPVNLV